MLLYSYAESKRQAGDLREHEIAYRKALKAV